MTGIAVVMAGQIFGWFFLFLPPSCWKKSPVCFIAGASYPVGVWVNHWASGEIMAAMAQILIEEKLGFHVLTQKGPGWAKRYSTSAISCTLISSNIINVIHTHTYIYCMLYYMWQGPFGPPFWSHLFPYLSPCLFPTCLLISLSPLRFFCLGAFGQRNLLVSRPHFSPLLSVLCSGGFGDRTQVPSVFVLVSLLHSHMWLFSLGASGAQYAPCPLSVSALAPLVLSNSCPPYISLSLSLAVLLSRCLFGHMILSGSSLVLPCSLQRVSLIPSPLLLLLGKDNQICGHAVIDYKRDESRNVYIGWWGDPYAPSRTYAQTFEGSSLNRVCQRLRPENPKIGPLAIAVSDQRVFGEC